MKLHKLIRFSAISIIRGTCNLHFTQTTVEMKLNFFTFFHLHKRSSARNLQSSTLPQIKYAANGCNPDSVPATSTLLTTY